MNCPLGVSDCENNVKCASQLCNDMEDDQFEKCQLRKFHILMASLFIIAVTFMCVTQWRVYNDVRAIHSHQLNQIIKQVKEEMQSNMAKHEHE